MSIARGIKNIIGNAGSVISKIGGNSKVVKTTAQTIGNSAPAVSGGRTVLKSFAEGASKTVTGTANVAGRAIVPVGVGLGAIFGTAKVYDYVQDVRAKTPEIRQYDQTLDQAERELKLIDQARKQQEQSSLGSSGFSMPSSGYAVGGGLSDYLPVLGAMNDPTVAQAKSSATKSVVFGVLGLALIGGGLYVANKKGMFKKK